MEQSKEQFKQKLIAAIIPHDAKYALQKIKFNPASDVLELHATIDLNAATDLLFDAACEILGIAAPRVEVGIVEPTQKKRGRPTKYHSEEERRDAMRESSRKHYYALRDQARAYQLHHAMDEDFRDPNGGAR